MIRVTDVAGRVKYVNCELIERIELVPDTMLVLTNGNAIIVRERPEDLISRIVQFKSRISAAIPSAPPLSLQQEPQASPVSS